MPKMQPDTPYNDLPKLDKLTADIETRSVLKLCIETHTQLAELRQAGKLLPDQGVLINTLPLIEAQASSEIENIVTTRDALFRQATLSNTDIANGATKEAFRYRTALRAGYDLLESRPLSTAIAATVCSTIKGQQFDVRKLPGTALGSSKTGEIIYTPPVDEKRLRDFLDDLFRFMYDRDEFDSLTKMAVGHYQFEAIHPFTDGNGRTGRILNILYLIEARALDVPTLYMSGYINKHRDDYYRLLLSVTESGAWQEWLEYMLIAVRESACRSRQKIEAIARQIHLTEAFIRESNNRLPVKDLTAAIFHQPYTRIQNLVDRGLSERQTASRYLRHLEDMGVMHSEQIGRDKVFINKAFLRLLLDDNNPVETFTRQEPPHA